MSSQIELINKLEHEGYVDHAVIHEGMKITVGEVREALQQARELGNIEEHLAAQDLYQAAIAEEIKLWKARLDAQTKKHQVERDELQKQVDADALVLTEFVDRNNELGKRVAELESTVNQYVGKLYEVRIDTLREILGGVCHNDKVYIENKIAAMNEGKEVKGSG